MRVPTASVPLKRLLLIVLLSVVGFGAVLYAVFRLGEHHLRAIDRLEKQEVRVIFDSMLAQGEIAFPPQRGTEYIVTSRHGNDPYLMLYTNAEGIRSGFFVTKMVLGKTNTWCFKEFGANQQILYRDQ